LGWLIGQQVLDGNTTERRQREREAQDVVIPNIHEVSFRGPPPKIL